MAFGILCGFFSFVALAVTGGFIITIGLFAIGFVAFTLGSIKAITGWNLKDDLGTVTNVAPLNPISNPKD